MKPNADDQPLREKIWRRELTPSERAELRGWLSAHPEAAADLELEKNLSGLLSRLPDAPVPSNFTARVLRAVELEIRDAERPRMTRPWWLRVLLLRAAVAAVLIGAGVFSYQGYQSSLRKKLAGELAAVAGVKSVPSPEALEDFEAIARLARIPAAPADEELMSLLATMQ